MHCNTDCFAKEKVFPYDEGMLLGLDFKCKPEDKEAGVMQLQMTNM